MGLGGVSCPRNRLETERGRGVQSSAWGAVLNGLGTKKESAKETKKEQPVIWEKMRKEARRVSCDECHMVRVGEALLAA